MAPPHLLLQSEFTDIRLEQAASLDCRQVCQLYLMMPREVYKGCPQHQPQALED